MLINTALNLNEHRTKSTQEFLFYLLVTATQLRWSIGFSAVEIFSEDISQSRDKMDMKKITKRLLLRYSLPWPI